tara:strand:+ start:474 stop:872 length:399 start_codon:yes stop_codon:yes gene_type:complete
MKTNKQEREAIASKFHKKMATQIVVKNEAFKKTSLYKELSKLEAESEKLNKEVGKITKAIQKKVSSFNRDNPSEYWKLTNDYCYQEQTRDYRLELESLWSCQTDLTNAILIAQVGADTFEEMMQVLEKEVAL